MKKSISILLLLLLTIGFTTEANGQTRNAEGILNVELQVSPKEFTFSELDSVLVSLRGENLSDSTVSPNFHRYELFVNGEVSFAWMLTVGNGLRPKKWYALPSGESVQMTWPTLAKSLFTEPGEYKLELRFEEEIIQTFTVDCIADEKP